MSENLENWMTGYRTAWESNAEADIRALFTDDARYFTEPFTAPVGGIDAIVASWLRRADPAGSTTFEWKPVVDDAELGIIQGETVYSDRRYSNLWVIRFAGDGRATEFTEWWMDQANPS